MSENDVEIFQGIKNVKAFTEGPSLTKLKKNVGNLDQDDFHDKFIFGPLEPIDK